MNQTCQTCRLYQTPKCWVRKDEGKDPGPNDWCAGWRKILSFYEREQMEDARNEAVVIRREMREGGKV